VKTLPYVAHAAIALSYDAASYEKDKWYHIKEADNVEFRWRLNRSLLYEVIAGTFNEKGVALQRANRCMLRCCILPLQSSPQFKMQVVTYMNPDFLTQATM